MAENMLSVVKYDAGGVEIKLEPETVKNYLVTDQFEGEGGTHTEFIEGLMSTDMRKTADDLACYMKNCV